MQNEVSSVDSVAAVLESLHVSDVQPSSLPTAIKLIDLPNEILERIVIAVVIEEDSFFKVACTGSKDHSIVSAKDGESRWSLPWLPNLRLVSRKINEVATPVIIDNTTVSLQLQRPVPGQTYQPVVYKEAIKLSKVCPQFMAQRIKTVQITDWPAMTNLLLVAKLDAKDLPALERVVYPDCDPAWSMGLTYGCMQGRVISGDVEFGRISWSCILDLLVGSKLTRVNGLGDFTRPELEYMCVREGPHSIFRHVVKNSLLRLFKYPQPYIKLVEIMIERCWSISRAGIQNLSPKTVLAVYFGDKTKGNYTVKYNINNEGPSITVWREAVEGHSRSRYLDCFG